MNLVMIGRFKDVGNAEAAKDVIEELQQFVMDHNPDGETYSPELMELFEKIKVYTIGRGELDQFRYDYSIEIVQNKVIIKTDESEVSALWKILIDRGAKVEMFSAHSHPDEAEAKE